MYTLSQAAEATGIPTQTLHAWERRYGAVTPERTPTGRRLYTLEHIQRLRLLKAGIDLGYRISALVKADDKKLQSLIAREGHEAHQKLLEYVRQMDYHNFELTLSAVYFELGAVNFVRNIVIPLMVDIGELWENGLLPIAAEHMATAMIRSYISSSLRLAGNGPPKSIAIFTTLEGEPHEIGVLAASVLAQNLDVDCIYLGPQMPPKDIAQAARHFNADIVCVGAKVLAEDNMMKQIETLTADIDQHVEVWVGGRSVRHASLSHLRFEIVATLGDFEQKIRTRHAAS